MNSSSLATLTFILIIIQITLPLSFSVFCDRLTCHVIFPTRNQSHILDMVIHVTSSDSSLAPSLSVTLLPTVLRLHSIDINSFLTDLQCSRLITNHPISLDWLLANCNTTLSSLLNENAPVIRAAKFPLESLNPTLGSLLLSALSSLKFATFGNALTLLWIGPFLNL